MPVSSWMARMPALPSSRNWPSNTTRFTTWRTLRSERCENNGVEPRQNTWWIMVWCPGKDGIFSSIQHKSQATISLMSSLELKLDDQSVSIRRYLWSSAPSFIEIKTTHRVVWKSACYYMVKIKIRHSTCWIAARDDESLWWEKKVGFDSVSGFAHLWSLGFMPCLKPCLRYQLRS